MQHLLFRLWLLDGRRKLRHLRSHVAGQRTVVDIGCGAGSVTTLLRARGHEVTPLDIRDQSLTAAVTPLLFDGKQLPFPEAHFDVALLLTVLHHANDPDTLLNEAARVAKRVCVIEDTYSNRAQRALTMLTDSIVNLEFRGHPHNNRSDAEWQATFKRHSLKLQHYATWSVAVGYRKSLFVLEASR